MGGGGGPGWVNGFACQRDFPSARGGGWAGGLAGGDGVVGRIGAGVGEGWEIKSQHTKS